MLIVGNVYTGMDGSKRRIWDDRISLTSGQRMIFFGQEQYASTNFDVEFDKATPEAFAAWAIDL